MNAIKVDIEVVIHRETAYLRPKSDAGQQWMANNLTGEWIEGRFAILQEVLADVIELGERSGMVFEEI